MSEWECGVCGYVHKGDEPPEKCPLCEAPKVMFKKRVLEEKKSEETPQAENTEVKQWRCTVSGYIHTGVQPPEKCPICEATSEKFEEVVEKGVVKEQEQAEESGVAQKRWRCTVCGYIHTGDEPPDSCPVCAAPKNMFVEIDIDGKAVGDVTEETAPPAAVVEEPEKSLFNSLGNLILKFHLHPITVHFPNGILPAVFIFLIIAVFLKIEVLEKAAYFNLIFVLVMLPVVIFTGYMEWQKRYKGIKTAVFVTKIICSIIVLASVNVLVFWRLIDPQVVAAGSPSQSIYLGVAALMLGAAGIAGHLGGNLVFGARK